MRKLLAAAATVVLIACIAVVANSPFERMGRGRIASMDANRLSDRIELAKITLSGTGCKSIPSIDSDMSRLRIRALEAIQQASREIGKARADSLHVQTLMKDIDRATGEYSRLDRLCADKGSPLANIDDRPSRVK